MNVKHHKVLKHIWTVFFFLMNTSNVPKIIGNHDYNTTSVLNGLITVDYMRN